MPQLLDVGSLMTCTDLARLAAAPIGLLQIISLGKNDAAISVQAGYRKRNSRKAVKRENGIWKLDWNI